MELVNTMNDNPSQISDTDLKVFMPSSGSFYSPPGGRSMGRVLGQPFSVHKAAWPNMMRVRYVNDRLR